MGRKNQIVKKYLTAQSLAASFNAAAIDVFSIDNIGINVETAGVTDNTGTFTVQHRMLKDAQTFSAWAELDLDTTPTLADDNDTFLINLNQVPPGQIRLVFTAAGGVPDGTCNAWFSGCMVGG